MGTTLMDNLPSTLIIFRCSLSRFLKDVTLSEELTEPLVDAWFTFREVRQNWLGFSRTGNRGHGLGRDFARALRHNFNSVFRDFGEETVTRSSHLEKLCLIRDGVGRDTISDFTTNLIKEFLATYTQDFARQFLTAQRRRKVALKVGVKQLAPRSEVLAANHCTLIRNFSNVSSLTRTICDW